MVTVKRSTNEITNNVELGRRSVIDLLENKQPSYNYAKEQPVNYDENLEDARARMQKNLDKILNYDKYAEVVDSVIEEYDQAVATESESNDVVIAQNDEDIRPTSTTMQFGEGDIDQMKREMNSASESAHSTYRLNGKGKMVVAIYMLALAVIMTLIVLNTGILAKLNASNQMKAQVLDAKVAEMNALEDEINSVSNDEFIIDKAQNEFGFVRK